MPDRLRWGPLALNPVTGRLATVPQDSDDDIAQQIEAVVRHRLGRRTDVPEMGVPDPTFKELPLSDDMVAMREVIDRHVPTASVLLSGGDALIEELVAEIRAEWARNPGVEDESA